MTKRRLLGAFMVACVIVPFFALMFVVVPQVAMAIVVSILGGALLFFGIALLAEDDK
jgi:hypothetical protein